MIVALIYIIIVGLCISALIFNNSTKELDPNTDWKDEIDEMFFRVNLSDEVFMYTQNYMNETTIYVSKSQVK